MVQSGRSASAESSFPFDAHRKPLSKYALKHYLAHFDFTNLRLDDAFRYAVLSNP